MSPSKQPTLFAPAELASDAELQQQIDLVSHSPIIDSILATIDGMLAILNPQRQVVGLNPNLLQEFGLQADLHLGLRLGSIVSCPHADEPPSGCGTTRYCASCGAAIATVAAQCKNRVVDEKCILDSQKAHTQTKRILQVHAAPLQLDQTRLTLLFLHDITDNERAANIERIFLHDLGNLANGIQGLSDSLQGLPLNQQARAQLLNKLSRRLAREVEIQQAIYQKDPPQISILLEKVSIPNLVAELQGMLTLHPSGRGKCFNLHFDHDDRPLLTDPGLLLRVLANMVINAFEAVEAGEEIRLSTSLKENGCSIQVWNPTAIPKEIQPRIFQLFYTTKSGPGRGLGSYTMKFLGEQYLGGKVSFSCSSEGTCFEIWLPFNGHQDGGYGLH